MSSGTQSIDRAALLLHTVVGADEVLSYTDIADECGLARSTTSRLLAALERTELLARGTDGGYVAGPLFWRYAARHDPWLQVARVARPVMEALGDDTGETVVLAAARGEHVAHLSQVDSRYLLGTRDWTAVEVPSHASALGKVLLAWGSQPMPIGGLAPLTESTITDLDKLRADLDHARERGWASTVDELEVGLSAVAVPVQVPSAYGTPVTAALGLSGPTARLADRLDELSAVLGERAGQLTALLTRRRPAEHAAATDRVDVPDRLPSEKGSR